MDCVFYTTQLNDFINNPPIKLYKNNICTQCKSAKVTTPSKPVISGLTNESKGIKVSWKKTANASGYYVYRKTGKGKFQKVATIKKGTTTSWTDASVKNKNGTTYQYQVYAYKGSVKSKVSASKAIIRLTVNKLTSVKNVKGRKLTVKWTRNKKAAGYEIQYSTSKKFKGAKTIKV